MPTNIQTVEISGDYEPINSFSAFKKLLRNLFTTPGPMFSFLEVEDISVNTFNSGYISGNRVYVSLTGGISYLFEIVDDAYTDITQVVVPPEEPPDEVVPSSGRLITKVSPEATTVPLTAASNYVVVDPIESPNEEDETLSGLGIYSDRPALLSITQHAYSEELFELIKEYRMSKIQECKSKIDGLDPKIRSKLKKEYTEEIQKVNGLISFSNDYLSNKFLLQETELELQSLKSDESDLLEEKSEKEGDIQQLIKQIDGLSFNPQEVSANRIAFESSAEGILTGIYGIYGARSLGKWATEDFITKNQFRYKVEPTTPETLASYKSTIASLGAVKVLIEKNLLPITDPTRATELFDTSKKQNNFSHLFLALSYSKQIYAEEPQNFDMDNESMSDNELEHWWNSQRANVLLEIENLIQGIQERIDNLQAIIEVMEANQNAENEFTSLTEQYTQEKDELQLQSATLQTQIDEIQSNISTKQDLVESLSNSLSRQNLSRYSGANEIFELSGFDFDRFTSFLSDQELITIQRQKQMYQANSAIGFLPKKELQVYNEVQWYLLKRYAEFLSKLDNPRLITFGIPSNAEEELGELLAAEIRIQPEDPYPFGKNIKFEGPIFLYNKDFFLVMKDDFSVERVDEVFDNTTNFLSFREKFRTRIGNFFTRYRISKNGIEEITNASSVPSEINKFRKDIVDLHDAAGVEPPLSTLTGNYKLAGRKILGKNVLSSDVPFGQNALLVNHGIDILTKELQRIYGGTVVDEESFPLDDESQKFVISTTAITSIESLSSDGFDSNVPLPETMSDSILMSQLVSPQNSLRKICSDKVFSRTFSTFIDEQMFPVTTTSAFLYDTQGTALTSKWKKHSNINFRWQSGPGSGNSKLKYAFYKTTNFTSNRRTGNMEIVIYHNGDKGTEIELMLQLPNEEAPDANSI